MLHLLKYFVIVINVYTVFSLLIHNCYLSFMSLHVSSPTLSLIKQSTFDFVLFFCTIHNKDFDRCTQQKLIY